MRILTKADYDSAVLEWEKFKQNQDDLEIVLPKNSIFNVYSENIEWLKERNNNSEFCAEIGIYNQQVILITIPLDEDGRAVAIEEYPYCILELLQNNLEFVEVESSMTVKKTVLSTNFEEISNESEVINSVINEPLIDKELAISILQLWQTEGYNWLDAEKKENGGVNIFEKFYVPSVPILSSENEINFVSAFALRYSEIYKKELPTLLFISTSRIEQVLSFETISNTYDYAKPCPPICKIPGTGTGTGTGTGSGSGSGSSGTGTSGGGSGSGSGGGGW